MLCFATSFKWRAWILTSKIFQIPLGYRQHRWKSVVVRSLKLSQPQEPSHFLVPLARWGRCSEMQKIHWQPISSLSHQKKTHLCSDKAADLSYSIIFLTSYNNIYWPQICVTIMYTLMMCCTTRHQYGMSSVRIRDLALIKNLLSHFGVSHLKTATRGAYIESPS